MTDTAKSEIKSIYQRAEKKNKSVRDIVEDRDNSSSDPGAETTTPVRTIVANARNQLGANDIGGALQTALDASNGLADLDADHDGSYVLAWQSDS